MALALVVTKPVVALSKNTQLFLGANPLKRLLGVHTGFQQPSPHQIYPVLPFLLWLGRTLPVVEPTLFLGKMLAPPFNPCQDGVRGLQSLPKFSLIRTCPLGWFPRKTASFLPIWILPLPFYNMPEGCQVSMCVSAWGLSLGFPVQVRNSVNRRSRGTSQLMMDGNWGQIPRLHFDLGILLCKF